MQYSVRWTAQSTFHFTPWQTYSFRHRLDLSGKDFSHAAITAEACVAKWQEKWEATNSNLNKYNIHPKERIAGGHTLPWRTWQTANRVRSGQAATPAAKHLWGYRESKNCMCGVATCDLNHNHNVMSCKHFGERLSKDDIAKMDDRSVRWPSAVADTT